MAEPVDGAGLPQDAAPGLAPERRLGRPRVWDVPGSQYPSDANGFQASGPWAGITKAVILGVPPYAYTSSADILADLRARDAAHPGVHGAGFRVTDPP
ncbi:hypothetical protein ACIRU2_32570 [Streptomyces sp. NPDC101169]|uniref:hypothetical protein n=1 Tax=Streptomyces sp. NPDC101169 TaxID=3366121 RepID=UPI00381150B0